MKKLLVFFGIILCCFVLFGCAERAELDEYRIVIPENADVSTKYASENLASILEEKSGISVPIVTDSEEEVEHEILIGETNREQSKTDTELSNGQYLLFEKDGKIVIKGYGIYVGAGCGEFVNKYAIIDTSSDEIDIRDVPNKERAFTFEFPDTYRNVIFMIGDGMGENHIKMAEKMGMNAFIAREFTATGISVTRSQSVLDGNAEYTDSAAGATAMSTGYKTINNYVGLDKNGNPVQNIRELAFSVGAKTAVVTTDVATGATPSSYMCHNISRTNTEELQAEIDALVAEGKIDYLASDVGDNLTFEVQKALATVSQGDSQFFVMIEEGIIDKRSHDKDKDGTIACVKRFNDVVAYATQFTLCHPDTLLIVTADHETGKLTEEKSLPYGYYFRSYQHTNANVPFFALGAGTAGLNGQTLENIELAKICAKAYSNAPFGQSWSEDN